MDRRAILVRVRRYLASWLRLVRDEARDVAADTLGLTQILTAAVAYFALIRSGGIEKMAADLHNLWQAIQALIYALATFLLICGIKAAFRVKSEEKTLGQWHGNGFIYKAPRLVFMTEVSDADNMKWIPFRVPDVEVNGSAELRVELDGLETKRIKVAILPKMIAETGLDAPWPWIGGGGSYNMLFVDKYKSFYLRVAAETCNKSIVRIYLVKWGIV
ncbi:MAG TPA: hypothetical protein VG821_06945 [Rhizomicrobium sp.]|nr:hypothetical protein [Rhizomicrobium sp.]